MRLSESLAIEVARTKSSEGPHWKTEVQRSYSLEELHLFSGHGGGGFRVNRMCADILTTDLASTGARGDGA